MTRLSVGQQRSDPLDHAQRDQRATGADSDAADGKRGPECAAASARKEQAEESQLKTAVMI